MMNQHYIFLILTVLFLRTVIFAEEIPLDAKIYVAGHRGLVGSAIVRKLNSEGYQNIITRSSEELDLRNQDAVNYFFAQEKPEYVFLAAAKVGGIKANEDFPADFIYDNLMIETNIIHAAYLFGVKKLLFLGSSCIYPKECPQPILESYLLTGPLEPTNEPYAIAKIAGIKLGQAYQRQYGMNFIACMPTNLYGPNDNFDLHRSHVLPALIRKFLEAKASKAQKVVLWGTGNPKREFLHSDDFANAALFLMRHYEGTEIINVGYGQDISISKLALMIKEIVGYEGDIEFDSAFPDGTPQKLLNIDKIRKMGWEPKVPLKEGIQEVVQWYIEHNAFADKP
jgi:GDP-L-fucose synthase